MVRISGAEDERDCDGEVRLKSKGGDVVVAASVLGGGERIGKAGYGNHVWRIEG